MTDAKSPDYQKRLAESRQLWDDAAASFDNAPDHGLRDPRTLAAWTTLLQTALPPGIRTVLDIGCGTGSLSLILAGLGCDVTGIDLSPAMLAHARAKAQAAGYSINFQPMDAAYPQLPPAHFDALICRHILWALPDPDQVLQRWLALLKPGGHLMLIEGFWHTGAGLHADQILNMLPASLAEITVRPLSDQPDLWGGPVADERYLITAHLRA
jgi:2-polyprenyl-3-methyl-5-hydroxy-6-metoxy-1,4-benzoquinol methylase